MKKVKSYKIGNSVTHHQLSRIVRDNTPDMSPQQRYHHKRVALDTFERQVASGYPTTFVLRELRDYLRLANKRVKKRKELREKKTFKTNSETNKLIKKVSKTSAKTSKVSAKTLEAFDVLLSDYPSADGGLSLIHSLRNYLEKGIMTLPKKAMSREQLQDFYENQTELLKTSVAQHTSRWLKAMDYVDSLHNLIVIHSIGTPFILTLFVWAGAVKTTLDLLIIAILLNAVLLISYLIRREKMNQ